MGLRGPGESQLEMDRREVQRRIVHLKHQLEEVRAHRHLYRTRRENTGIPVVAIVGYTNAGKSTLLKALTGADVLIADQLFATLDPTTRRVTLPGGHEVLFTDTVGFIQRLPTTLVAAFRATLEEVLDADVLVHVIDITHPHVSQQAETVGQVLAELGATDKPIIAALNKVDLLGDSETIRGMITRQFSSQESPLAHAVLISAAQGLGLERLLERTEEILGQTMAAVQVLVPYQRADLAAAIHRHGIVDHERHEAEGTHIRARVPRSMLGLLTPFSEHTP